MEGWQDRASLGLLTRPEESHTRTPRCQEEPGSLWSSKGLASPCLWFFCIPNSLGWDLKIKMGSPGCGAGLWLWVEQAPGCGQTPGYVAGLLSGQ